MIYLSFYCLGSLFLLGLLLFPSLFYLAFTIRFEFGFPNSNLIIFVSSINRASFLLFSSFRLGYDNYLRIIQLRISSLFPEDLFLVLPLFFLGLHHMAAAELLS